MSKNLVIVESPSKAKTISKYLGKGFIVEPTVGHIKDLPKSNLGIELDKEFKMKLVVIRGKSDIIKKIKSSADKVKNVYIATDPDREGEAIAYDVFELINKKDVKINRVLFNEITERGIKEGMSNPRDIDLNLVDSQRARRVMDRIIGYQLSPLLWNHLVEHAADTALSAGRVQSVTLRLICERENLINSFIPFEYWSVFGLFSTEQRDEIHAKLYKINEKVYRVPENAEQANSEDYKLNYFYIKDSNEADEILNLCKKENYSISLKEKKEVNRYPQAPFTTSTLQQEASKKLGYRPRQTMQYAQKLYEGVEVGKDGLVGLITYMRTDSTRINDDSVRECRNFINDLYGNEYLSEVPKNYIKKKSNVQDAHEAIRPTNLKYTPQLVKEYLPKELFRLYELIWKRFIACQMSPAKFEQTTLEISGGPFVFKANGLVSIFRGYLIAYDDIEIEKNEETEEEENEGLPYYLKESDKLDVIEINERQHFTKPPARYTESSIVKELDNLGIGRPSTYASIIGTLYDRNYVISQDKKLFPTKLGVMVNDLLVKHFDSIININFTAQMESELDEIEEGNNTYLKSLNDFYIPFNKNFTEVEKHFHKNKCEKCGSDMEIKMGRFGRFLACTNYPECKNIKSLKSTTKDEPEKLDEKCPKCGNDLIYRNSKFGKFIGCSNYPQCDYTRTITLNLKCPKCNVGEITQRITKSRKVFYGCNNYPNCDYANWDRPTSNLCPECSKDYLVEKLTKTGIKIICNSCKYIQNQDSKDIE